MTHKHYPGKIAPDWFGLSVPLGRLSKRDAPPSSLRREPVTA